MPGNPSDTPVVYDAINRELRTVRDYFAEKGEEVLDIRWEVGIEGGAEVSPNQHLAQIIWDGAPEEPVNAPPECRGIIEWINGRIEYEMLDLKPQVLLRLRSEGGRTGARHRRHGRW